MSDPTGGGKLTLAGRFDGASGRTFNNSSVVAPAAAAPAAEAGAMAVDEAGSEDATIRVRNLMFEYKELGLVVSCSAQPEPAPATAAPSWSAHCSASRPLLSAHAVRPRSFSSP